VQIYAWIVGQLSSLVMKQDDEVVSKRAQLELVNAYIASIRVPRDLKQRLTTFFRARLKNKSLSTVHGDTIYFGLPSELQIEVSRFTNRSVVEAARLLRGCSAGFVDRMSSLLSERAPESETVIYRTEEACKELIFVAQGAIETFTEPDDSDVVDVVSTHCVGDTLGDVAFIFNIRHVTNARAAPNCQTKIFVLAMRSWRELIKTFPGQEEIIMDNAISVHEGIGTQTARSLMGRKPSIAASRSGSISMDKRSETGSLKPATDKDDSEVRLSEVSAETAARARGVCGVASHASKCQPRPHLLRPARLRARARTGGCRRQAQARRVIPRQALLRVRARQL
jgi:hypothetical protein